MFLFWAYILSTPSFPVIIMTSRGPLRGGILTVAVSGRRVSLDEVSDRNDITTSLSRPLMIRFVEGTSSGR